MLLQLQLLLLLLLLLPLLCADAGFHTKTHKKIAPLRGAYLYCIITQNCALRTK